MPLADHGGQHHFNDVTFTKQGLLDIVHNAVEEFFELFLLFVTHCHFFSFLDKWLLR